MTQGYVYLMKADNLNAFKIGKTINAPEQRLSTINTGSPVVIELVTYALANDCDAVEKYLHQKFEHCRTKGEWFEFDDDSLIDVKMDFYELHHGSINRLKLELSEANRKIRQLESTIASFDITINSIINAIKNQEVVINKNNNPYWRHEKEIEIRTPFIDQWS